MLFLDEPTTGLDPRGRAEVWEAVRALVRDGVTVLLTTQYLEEADQLADRICVLDQGATLAEGTPDQLKAALGGDRIELVVRDTADLPATAELLTRVTGTDAAVEPDTRTVSAPATSSMASGRGSATPRVGGAPLGASAPPSAAAAIRVLTRAFRELDAAGIDVEDLRVRRPTLDEVYLHLTQQPQEVAR